MAEKQEGPLNSQIEDAIAQVNGLVNGEAGTSVRAMSYQLMAHSVALAMYNTVQQQQQAYVLQNAIVTAAAKAALENDPKDAIALAKEGMNPAGLTDSLAELKRFMDELNDAYSDLSDATSARPGKKKDRS